MSALYSIRKPTVRKAIMEKAHNEESYEDFVGISHKNPDKIQV